MMATDKRSLRGSLWEKAAGDGGLEGTRLQRGTICTGHEQHEATFLHLFFFCTCFWKTALVSMKNRIADEAGRPLVLTNAHLCAAQSLLHPARGAFWEMTTQRTQM